MSKTHNLMSLIEYDSMGVYKQHEIQINLANYGWDMSAHINKKVTLHVGI